MVSIRIHFPWLAINCSKVMSEFCRCTQVFCLCIVWTSFVIISIWYIEDHLAQPRPSNIASQFHSLVTLMNGRMIEDMFHLLWVCIWKEAMIFISVCFVISSLCAQHLKVTYTLYMLCNALNGHMIKSHVLYNHWKYYNYADVFVYAPANLCIKKIVFCRYHPIQLYFNESALTFPNNKQVNISNLNLHDCIHHPK